MYPSPRQLYVPPTKCSAAAEASPKKKPRPNVLRQMYALPAIHQFEPVLSSHSTVLSSSPRSSYQTSVEHEIPSAISPLSPTSPRNLLAQEGTVSPRLRPQPPPPLSSPPAAIVSRTDQNLFRYSQSVTQRMAIRPLFEQRREDEADIARRILASRGAEPGHSQQTPSTGAEPTAKDQDDKEPKRQPVRPQRTPAAHGGSRRGTTPVTVRELADVRSGPQSTVGTPKNSETPRAKRERLRHHEETDGDMWIGPATEPAYSKADDIAASRARFSTPTPPSSAGPSRSHIGESVSSRLNSLVSEECLASECDTQPPKSEETSIPPANEDRVQEDPAPASGGDTSLVSLLTASTLYTPFLEKRGSKINWLASNSSPEETLDTRSKKTTSPPHALAATVCYKLLWRDTKTITRQDHETDTFDLRVLLGSNGKAHISIQPHSTSLSSSLVVQEELKLTVSESDVMLSAKTRPDVAVLTPKWARWVLSRLERDVHGVWFLRLQDIGAMDNACVFTGDVTVKVSVGTETTDDDHVVSVAIYLLGADDEGLLVHARDRSAILPTLTEIVLKRHELSAITASLGYLVSINETDVGTALIDSHMHVLLRDPFFLEKAVAESKAVRLALRSGLHITETTDAAPDLLYQIATVSDEQRGTQPMTSEPSIISPKFAAFDTHGLTYATPEILALVRANEQLAEIAFLSQAYWEDAAASVLRWLQRTQAVDMYVANYMSAPMDEAEAAALHDAVQTRIEAATQVKLEDIAARSIVDDMLADFVAVECRVALHDARVSGGYDDHYASKVQSAFRMSYQRRDYVSKRNTRLRAAQLIQALQRAIQARRRYAEMRIEREKYLFYSLRSSLHQSTEHIENPRRRAIDSAREMERRRQSFLMQVVHGYIKDHGLEASFQISAELVQRIINEYSVVVGCTPTLGDAVAAILVTSRPALPPGKNAGVNAPLLFGSSEIHAALLTALRMQYDDTFGLASTIRHLTASEASPFKAQRIVNQLSSSAEETTPPRWLLKASPPFQRANRNRLAALRLTRKATGQRAAHLVALDYRTQLHQSYQGFEQCRGLWEDTVRTRQHEARLYDAFSIDNLVQFALDKLLLAVKDWGLDPEPLFEALNFCLLHRLGKPALALVEQAFDRFADSVNERHGKRHVYPLRDEITQELEEFEALLALRCLNMAHDGVVTVPPSEILHVLLMGNVDVEYLRHALPTVLPVASVQEKSQLADKMIRSYASAADGNAFNSICWSCLDTAESVTVEAAQFLERITLHSAEDGNELANTSIAARALYLLTGAQALAFLQFLAKVAHFTKPLQRRVLGHLAVHACDVELYRFATVVCSLDSFEVVTRLFDNCFRAASVHHATRFWVQYSALYGEVSAETARTSCAPLDGSEEQDVRVDQPDEENVGAAGEPVVLLREPIAA